MSEAFVLQEFEPPMMRLISDIPHKTQKSLFKQGQDVEWRCFDVNKEYFAICTSDGFLYVYDRNKDIIQHRLGAKQAAGRVRPTKVKLIKVIDTVVAVGNEKGVVTIFHLVADSGMRAFTVSQYHNSAITALEWSQNSMKLFSGDATGTVVCTEIDYATNCSASFVMCKETQSIVQLSYAYRTLLVSTNERTVVCQRENETGTITQIGQAARKRLGPFGATFIPGSVNVIEASIYASRPGLRIWQARSDGTVAHTLTLKDKINEKASKNIVILPESTTPHPVQKDLQFGPVILYLDHLITYNGSGLYVIQKENNDLIAYHSNLGDIIEVSVCEDEVFILRNMDAGSLIRLAKNPLTLKNFSIKQEFESMPVLGQKAAKMTKSIFGALKEVGEKIQTAPNLSTTKIFSNISQNLSHRPPAGSSNVIGMNCQSEASRNFPENNISVGKGNEGIICNPVPNKETEARAAEPARNFGTICLADDNNDEIVFKKRSKKKIAGRKSADNISLSSTGSGDATTFCTTPTSGIQSLSTPTMVVQSSSTPTLGIQSLSTPTTGVESSSTPIMGVQSSSTPIMVVQSSSTPTLGIQSLSTPTTGVESSSTPIMGVQSSSTPTMGVQSSSTPTMVVQSSSTRMMGVQFVHSLSTTSPTPMGLIELQETTSTVSVQQFNTNESDPRMDLTSTGSSPIAQCTVSNNSAFRVLDSVVQNDSVSSQHESVQQDIIESNEITFTAATSVESCAQDLQQMNFSSVAEELRDFKIGSNHSDSENQAAVICQTEQSIKCETKQDMDCQTEQGMDQQIEQGIECQTEQGIDCLTEQDIDFKTKIHINCKTKQSIDETDLDTTNIWQSRNIETVREPILDSANDSNLPSALTFFDRIETSSPGIDDIPEASQTPSGSSFNEEAKESREENIFGIDLELLRGNKPIRDHVFAPWNKTKNEPIEPVEHELENGNWAVSSVVIQDETIAMAALKDNSDKAVQSEEKSEKCETEIDQITVENETLQRSQSLEDSISISIYSVRPPAKPESSNKDVKKSLAPCDKSQSNEINPTKVPATKNDEIQTESPSAKKTTLNCFTQWKQFHAPARLKSMCVSSLHIWCVDERSLLHYSKLSEPKLAWIEDKAPADQISVSHSGDILWRLYQGCVFAAAKGTTTRCPMRFQWIEVAREVANIAVDERTAWYVKIEGEVIVHKGLSKDRPCFRHNKVPSCFKMRQIACRNGVVWGKTDENTLVVRAGIDEKCEEGKEWVLLRSKELDKIVCSFDLAGGGLAWAVDHFGRMWFMTDISRDQPAGSGIWWQVPLGSNLMSEPTIWQSVKLLMINGQQRQPSRFHFKDQKGIVCSRSHTVWFCPNNSNTLYLSPGDIMGYRYQMVTFEEDFKYQVPGKKISKFSVTGSGDRSDLLWMMQSSGLLFVMNPAAPGRGLTRIEPPTNKSVCVSLSATTEFVWCVYENGNVYIRRHMDAEFPHGIGWEEVDLSQISDKKNRKLEHVSIGCKHVWGVDNKGKVYLRIGAMHRPFGHYLNPAWLPVGEHFCDLEEVKFKRVFSSPNDLMVWAIDKAGNIYARTGITENFQVGKKWVLVDGFQGVSIAVSNHHAYVTTVGRELVVRHGITADLPEGDTWQQLPGSFVSVSVNANDELWAVDEDGHLYQQYVHLIKRAPILTSLSGGNDVTDASIPDDWEILD